MNTAGKIDERGYLNSMMAQGFDTYKCFCELIANSIDAGATEIDITINGDTLEFIDNGVGMSADKLNDMFCMHYANSSVARMGVYGVGAKNALLNLSNSTQTHIYTQDNIAFIPWNNMLEQGKYTGMIQLTKNTEHITGTRIILPSTKEIQDILDDQFNSSSRLNPAIRFSTIFGMHNIIIRYNELVLKLYNPNNNGPFDTGISEHTIDVYFNKKSRDTRYITTIDGVSIEIYKSGRGFDSSPSELCVGLDDYSRVGIFQLKLYKKNDDTHKRTIRVDVYNHNINSTCIYITDEGVQIKLFGKKYIVDTTQHNMKDYTFKESIFIQQFNDTYETNHHHSQYDLQFMDNDEFISKLHLYRNGQFIGCDNIPGMSFSSSRGNSESHLKSIIHCDLLFNPTSIQNNIMDQIAGIQTNKNQRSIELPVPLLRIIQKLRDDKFNMLKKHYLKNTISIRPVPPKPAPEDTKENGIDAFTLAVVTGSASSFVEEIVHSEQTMANAKCSAKVSSTPKRIVDTPELVHVHHDVPPTNEKSSSKKNTIHEDISTRLSISCEPYTIDTIIQHPDVRTILNKLCTFDIEEQNKRLHYIISQLN